MLIWTAETFRLLRIKREQSHESVQEGIFSVFSHFLFQKFFTQIFILKFWEGHKKMQNFMWNIVAYLIFQWNRYLKNFISFFVSLTAPMDDLVGVDLLNLTLTRKTYLKNKVDSFVEKWILYRMSLEWSLSIVLAFFKNIK